MKLARGRQEATRSSMGRTYRFIVAVLLLFLVQDGLGRPGGLDDEFQEKTAGLFGRRVERDVDSEEEDDEMGPEVAAVNPDEDDEEEGGALRRKRGACEHFVGDELLIEVDTVSVEAEAVSIHNELREIHGAPDLASDAGLQETAAAYADKLCRDPNKAFEHSHLPERNGAGENLFMKMRTIGKKGMMKEVARGSFKSKLTSSPGDAVCSWYREEECFDFSTGKKIPGCGIVGHFTQEVWAKTLKVGCARATCNRMDQKSCKPTIVNFVVCHYSPHGNVSGGNKNNVIDSNDLERKAAMELVCKGK